jgi:hypothetical protein
MVIEDYGTPDTIDSYTIEQIYYGIMFRYFTYRPIERVNMKTYISLAVMCMLCLTGCKSSALSMNKKMAYANSAATLGTAVAMDEIALDKFDDSKAKIIEICEALKKFADDGQIADLPVDLARQKVEEFMIKKGWSAYIPLIDMAFAWVQVQHVDVDKIGPNNVMIIKQALDGIESQAARAKKEWTTQSEAAAKSAARAAAKAKAVKK